MLFQMLDQKDVERIHEASLEVLSKTGVYFWNNPEAIRIFKENGCRTKESRVFFPRKLVERCLSQLPERKKLKFYSKWWDMKDSIGLAKGQVNIGLIGHAYYLFDFDKGFSRDCVKADLEGRDLIVDNLRNFDMNFCDLVLHSDRHRQKYEDTRLQDTRFNNVDESIKVLRQRVQDKVRRDAGKTIHAHTYSKEEARIEILSHIVVRGLREVENQLRKDAALVWVNPISPLQYYEGESKAIIGTVKEKGSSCFVMISPEIMMGATGPATLAGTLVQQNAEVLAGTVLTQLVNPGTPVIYGCVSSAMDLRNAEVSHGNIETPMIDAAAVQMADFYGMPSRISPGNTSAKRPGVRAATEAALGIYMGIAAGGNIITTGLLDSTLMISYEHLIVLDEMINQIKRAVGGIKTDEERLSVDLIHEQGHPSPNYLSSSHTLKFMKDIYYSDFVGRTKESYEDWYKKAQKKAKRILTGPSFKEADIGKEIKERLNSVEKRLKEDNNTWREEKYEQWWKYYTEDFS